jgi:hypothetical protein
MTIQTPSTETLLTEELRLSGIIIYCLNFIPLFSERCLNNVSDFLFSTEWLSVALLPCICLLRNAVVITIVKRR